MTRENGMVCLLVGIGIGAAAGLLLAPHAGVETRKRIRNSTNEAGDYVKERANALAERAENVASEARQAFENVRSKGKEVLKDLKAAV